MTRIAVVTPRSVPPVEGGNERHWRSLTQALLEAGYDADLVAVDTRESNLSEVLASYRRFVDLDLSGYDVVISGKYPSFMVRHARHIRHLNHTLRGLYEHYPTHLGTLTDVELIAGIEARRENAHTLLDWAEAQVASHVDEPDFAFPGPFARSIVKALDRIGRDHLSLESTVSERVAQRPDYVDPTRPIAVIPPLGDLTSRVAPNPGGTERASFLTFGRIDHIKRFDLIIRAFGAARLRDAELIVSGEGPAEESIRELAKRTSGVHMVGRLDDDALAEAMAGARAAILAPVDEDYGLVAAEAMASGTPVITTTDSGGIAEQIEHGRTGLISHPHPIPMARSIRRLGRDRDLAARMGRQGMDATARLTWDPMLRLVERVLEAAVRPRLLVLSTFPADPVVSGGHRRLRGVAAGLAQEWDVAVLSLTNRIPPSSPPIRRRTEDGVEHVLVPRSEAHLRADLRMTSIVRTPVDDIGCSVLFPTSPSYVSELRDQLDRADAVMLSHPYLAPSLPSTLRIPVVYDAHNVEVDLKQGTLGRHAGAEWLVDRTREAEGAALAVADLLTASSDSDLEVLETRAGPLHRRALVVPNPLDPLVLASRTDPERADARRRFFADLDRVDDGRPLVLFVGSDHPPNRRAVSVLLDVAENAPDLHVVIAGSVGGGGSKGRRERCTRLPHFAPRDLRRVLSMADVTVNPVEVGSGTSLKLIDPLSLGIPVVATEIGARGIEDPEKILWLSTIPDLASTIRRVIAEPDEAERRSRLGRELSKQYRTGTVVEPLLAELDARRRSR